MSVAVLADLVLTLVRPAELQTLVPPRSCCPSSRCCCWDCSSCATQDGSTGVATGLRVMSFIMIALLALDALVATVRLTTLLIEGLAS